MKETFYKLLIPKDDFKDPDRMFEHGQMAQEASMCASLTRYVVKTSGDYRVLQEIFSQFVEDEIMDQQSLEGYMKLIKYLEIF